MPDAPVQPGPRPASASGVVTPHRASLLQRCAAWLVYAALQGLAATLRFRLVDRTGLLATRAGQPLLYACWHNRLALSLICYHRHLHPLNPTRGLAAMVSASRDGAFLAAILEAFRVQPVRGSSSRRGRQALLELTTWSQRGYDLAITPDGPRGPCYHVQDGITSLAQITGLPIIPFCYNLGWKIQLKSWDRFQIPLPFSRCDVIFDQPIAVPRDATDAERAALRRKLQEVMRGLARD